MDSPNIHVCIAEEDGGPEGAKSDVHKIGLFSDSLLTSGRARTHAGLSDSTGKTATGWAGLGEEGDSTSFDSTPGDDVQVRRWQCTDMYVSFLG